MSRYTIADRGEGLFTPYRIYGADGERIATISVHVESEAERLKRWIEAHDEVVDILRGVGKISRRSELEAKADELIARIEGGTE